MAVSNERDRKMNQLTPDEKARYRKFCREVDKNMKLFSNAPSEVPMPKSRGAAQLVGSDAVVRLRSLLLICVAQAGLALVMAALGIVGSETVIPACYFSFSTFVGVWVVRDKPNAEICNEPKNGEK